jgi:hypothetical protein
MGYGNEVRIQLRRDNPGVSWGFRLHGGKEVNSPLSVQRVFSGSPSDGQLQRGDVILSVDNQDVRNAQQGQAQDFIQNSGLVLSLIVERSVSSNYDSYVPPSTNTGYPQQQQSDRQQFSASQPAAISPPQQQSWKSQATGSSFHQQTPQYGGGQQFGSATPSHGSGGRSNYEPAYQDGQPSFRSTTATFTPPKSYHSPQGGQQQQGYGTHSPSGGRNVGDQWDDKGGYDQPVRSPPQGVTEEEDFEHKTVGNIRQKFNTADEFENQGTSRIKRAHPRAPMHRAGDESSFATHHFGPTPAPAKSSLTPSRPGAIQRGAPDSRPSHSYIPPPPPDTSGAKRTPTLYGYGDQNTSGGSKYTGGFVGVNALIKPQAPNAPIKRPPGQKKKDFDPSQSSVLRILQEDEQRGRGRSRGQHQGENGYDEYSQGQQHSGQGRQIQDQGKMSKGQQWQQQQQRQTSAGGGSTKAGGSLQALLEKDLQQNPQEDPRVQHNPQLAPSAAPTAEYRRPGTAYKPSQNQARPAASVDDYPLPERYDYTQQAPAGGGGEDSYQSTYYPTGGSFQSTYPATRLSAAGASQFGPGQTGPGQTGSSQSSRQFAQSYPASSGYSQYPSSAYGPGGVPACDF